MEEQKIASGPIMQQMGHLDQLIPELQETIAQIKYIEASMQEMRAIFSSFANGLQQGLAVVQDGNIIWANKAGCRIFGYETGELIGTPGIRLAHPDYREKLAKRFAEIQAGDVWTRREVWPCLTKNQLLRQIKGYASCIVYNGKPAILTILVDVTEEQALQNELSMRAEMLDSVSDEVFLHDMDGKIRYVNKAACVSLGYTQNEMTNMSIIDIYPEELKRRASNRLKTVSSNKAGRFKTVHVRKNGGSMHVDVKSRVVTIGNREFVLAVVREIIPEDLLDM